MNTKRHVELDADGDPTECPNSQCDSSDIAISNIDGYECCECGCWFDHESGRVVFAYKNAPEEI